MAQLKLGQACQQKHTTSHEAFTRHHQARGENMDQFPKTLLKVSVTMSIHAQLIRASMTSATALPREHIISKQMISH